MWFFFFPSSKSYQEWCFLKFLAINQIFFNVKWIILYVLILQLIMIINVEGVMESNQVHYSQKAKISWNLANRKLDLNLRTALTVVFQ